MNFSLICAYFFIWQYSQGFRVLRFARVCKYLKPLPLRVESKLFTNWGYGLMGGWVSEGVLAVLLPLQFTTFPINFEISLSSLPFPATDSDQTRNGKETLSPPTCVPLPQQPVAQGNISHSKTALTHTFKKLRGPARCRECDTYVYFHGHECDVVSLRLLLLLWVTCLLSWTQV